MSGCASKNLRRVLVAVLLGGLVISVRAADEGAKKEPAKSKAPEPELKLKLRIHALKSGVAEVNAEPDEAELKRMVAGINEIWAPANIRFELDRITEDAARDEAAQQEWAALCQRGGQELFGKLAPVIKRLLPELPVEQGVFHIALVHRFPRGFGGRYFPELGLILAPQAVNPGPAARPLEADEAAGAERPLNPKIMAHELGHALSLLHVSLPENLMTSGPNTRGVQRGSKLTEEQIAQSRKVATEGKPFFRQRPPGPPGERDTPKKN